MEWLQCNLSLRDHNFKKRQLCMIANVWLFLKDIVATHLVEPT